MASDYLKRLSPEQIWKEKIKPTRTLVVKNISSAITEQYLLYYLENVSGEDLTSMYFYPDVTSICLAVFKSEITDIEEVQKKAHKNPQKPTLELLPLGSISGLLLSNISGPVNNDGLTLYFESRKCGSQDADVKDCKYLMDLNIAVIKMNASPEECTDIEHICILSHGFWIGLADTTVKFFHFVWFEKSKNPFPQRNMLASDMLDQKNSRT